MPNSRRFQRLLASSRCVNRAEIARRFVLARSDATVRMNHATRDERAQLFAADARVNDDGTVSVWFTSPIRSVVVAAKVEL